MIKFTRIEPLKLMAVAIFTALWLSGCQTSLGPWERQAYVTPNVETPVNKVKVSPGSPLPFEQRLPAGNLNRPSVFGR